MGDILTTAERSERMSRVRHAGTAPELALRKALYARGLRYRLNVGSLPGRPDLVFTRYPVVVFVHGCFWHGHRCSAGHVPSTNRAYWLPKLEANRARDARKARQLRQLGLHVWTVWECQLKTTRGLLRTVQALERRIQRL
jgi:DNA mismatch endonuclease, patch repair protein